MRIEMLAHAMRIGDDLLTHHARHAGQASANSRDAMARHRPILPALWGASIRPHGDRCHPIRDENAEMSRQAVMTDRLIGDEDLRYLARYPHPHCAVPIDDCCGRSSTHPNI